MKNSSHVLHKKKIQNKTGRKEKQGKRFTLTSVIPSTCIR